MANISSARSVGVGYRSSGWVFNPYFGTLTFVPGYGQFMSPFGWSFWSPFSVGQYYSNYSYQSFYGGSSGGFNRGWTGRGWDRRQDLTPTMQQGGQAVAGGSGSRGRWSHGPATGSSPAAGHGPRGGFGGGRITGGGGNWGGGGHMGGGGGHMGGGGHSSGGGSSR